MQNLSIMLILFKPLSLVVLD